MSEEDLELLITLDDPGQDDLEEDTFNHPQVGNTIAPADVATRAGHEKETGEIVEQISKSRAKSSAG